MGTGRRAPAGSPAWRREAPGAPPRAPRAPAPPEVAPPDSRHFLCLLWNSWASAADSVIIIKRPRVFKGRAPLWAGKVRGTRAPGEEPPAPLPPVGAQPGSSGQAGGTGFGEGRSVGALGPLTAAPPASRPPGRRRCTASAGRPAGGAAAPEERPARGGRRCSPTARWTREPGLGTGGLRRGSRPGAAPGETPRPGPPRPAAASPAPAERTSGGRSQETSPETVGASEPPPAHLPPPCCRPFAPNSSSSRRPAGAVRDRGGGVGRGVSRAGSRPRIRRRPFVLRRNVTPSPASGYRAGRTVGGDPRAVPARGASQPVGTRRNPARRWGESRTRVPRRPGSFPAPRPCASCSAEPRTERPPLYRSILTEAEALCRRFCDASPSAPGPPSKPGPLPLETGLVLRGALLK